MLCPDRDSGGLLLAANDASLLQADVAARVAGVCMPWACLALLELLILVGEN